MRSFLVSTDNLETVLEALRLVVTPRSQGAVHCVPVDAGMLLVAANETWRIDSVLEAHELAKDYSPVDDLLEDDEDDGEYIPWEEQQARREAGYKFYEQLKNGPEPTLLHPMETDNISRANVEHSSAVIREERFKVYDAPLVLSDVGNKHFAPAEVLLNVSVRSGNPKDSTYSIWLWPSRLLGEHSSAHFSGDLRSLSDSESFRAPSWLIPYVKDLEQVTKDLFGKAGLASN